MTFFGLAIIFAAIFIEGPLGWVMWGIGTCIFWSGILAEDK